MINRQELLNKVFTFMMKQNQKCIKPGNDNYQYHYQELRCNAGVLIPVEDYKPEFESKLSGLDGESEATTYFESKGFSDSDLCWLRDLQIVHDDYEVNEWQYRFECFAMSYNLTLPQILPQALPQREFING